MSTVFEFTLNLDVCQVQNALFFQNLLNKIKVSVSGNDPPERCLLETATMIFLNFRGAFEKLQ